jgi:hypothetical protein
MRKILISAALVSAAALAAPAAAQYYPDQRYPDQRYPDQSYDYDHRGGDIGRQLDQIRRRINMAEDRNRISRREAAQLLAYVEDVERIHARYRRDGLTQWERSDLQNRLQYLRDRLRYERQDDRYDRYRPYDRNDGRWEDGRWDDRYDDNHYDDRWDDD